MDVLTVKELEPGIKSMCASYKFYLSNQKAIKTMHNIYGGCVPQAALHNMSCVLLPLCKICLFKKIHETDV